MKISVVLFLLLIGLTIQCIVNGVKGTYQYEKEYGSYWELADKASTIEKKG